MPTTRPQQGTPLIAGIPLEQGHSWPHLFRFALWSVPVLWVLVSIIELIRSPHIMLPFDALAISLPGSLLLTALYFFLAPLFGPSTRLVLRNNHLRIEANKHPQWSLTLDDPFFATLLLRDHKEDGLLILLPKDNPEPALFYGRFRLEHPRPDSTLSISSLRVSLAEEAIDRLQAQLLPDRTTEHLPALTQTMFAAPGFAQGPLRLPIHPTPRQVQCTPLHFQWLQDDTPTSADYTELEAIPHAILNQQELQLLFSINAKHDGSTLLTFALEWPHKLFHEPLPTATQTQLDHAILLSPIEGILLLAHLQKKQIIQQPFSLFQPHDTQPDC